MEKGSTRTYLEERPTLKEVPLVFSLDDPSSSLRSTLQLCSSPSLSLSPSKNLITRLSSFSSAVGDLIEGCRYCKLDKKTSFYLRPHNGTDSALETCSSVPFLSNKLFVEINFLDESGCSGNCFLFLFLLGMESIALALSSSMSIVPKLTFALNFFDLASKKHNWGGQTLSYSYCLLCPISVLL